MIEEEVDKTLDKCRELITTIKDIYEPIEKNTGPLQYNVTPHNFNIVCNDINIYRYWVKQYKKIIREITTTSRDLKFGRRSHLVWYMRKDQECQRQVVFLANATRKLIALRVAGKEWYKIHMLKEAA